MGEQVAAPFSRAGLYSLPLRFEPAHDGAGATGAVRVASGAQVQGCCHFIDFAELPPGASIGDHRHADDEEEYYLVLSGTGTMRLEDEYFPVHPGDLVRNPPGGLHGLRNTGAERIRLFVFELARHDTGLRTS